MNIETSRLILEPIQIGHAQEFFELFSDPNLHTYVPFEPPTLEEQIQRCQKWLKGQSSDGNEIWLNFAARDKLSKKIVGHFQAGVTKDLTSTIGYVVARVSQRKGYAYEALVKLIEILKQNYQAKTLTAYTDSRNIASHRLAEKLGMKKIKVVENADFFKGETSHEFIFAKDL